MVTVFSVSSYEWILMKFFGGWTDREWPMDYPVKFW